MPNNLSSASFLTVDTVSFEKLFMCKLESTNDIKNTLVVYTPKKTEKNKLEDVLNLSHFFGWSYLNIT